MDREETQKLSEPLTLIRDAAGAASMSMKRLSAYANETRAELTKTQTAVNELLKAIDRSRFESLENFITALRDVRTWRGHTVGLRELRYIDLAVVETIDNQLHESADRLGQRCVLFLLQPNSLDTYRQNIAATTSRIDKVQTVAEGRQLEQQFQDSADALELLIELFRAYKSRT